jgi:FMN phosphatase YigB (HAD superfamily)
VTVVNDLEEARALVDDSEVVSFDFFDTLVTRSSATPDAVQQYVGYRLSREDPRLDGFFARRKGAESSVWARRPDIGDADLETIYAEFPVDAGWSEEATARASRLEQEVDRAFLVPRAAVVGLLRRARAAGKRVILVSDSYYRRAFFEEVIERFGWSGLVDDIYVSSEYAARKGTGALWTVVSSRERLADKRFVHIGDDPRSDVEMARAVGLRCVLIPGPPTLVAEHGIRHEAGRDWRADILLGPLYARWGGDPSVGPRVIDDEEELGYVAYGPIFLAFFAWLATHPALCQLKRLYFSSREGHFLQRLYERMREDCALDNDLPASRYLPMSRRAVIMASQATSFDPAGVTEAGGFQGSAESLLRARLGYTINWTRRLVFPVRLPKDREYVQRILRILQPQIVARAAVERAAMVAYCRQVGLLEEEPIGLVDVGYSATIQHGLQQILGRPLSGFYMATSSRAAAAQQGGGRAYGCFQDALRGDMRPEDFMHRTVLLEALLTAPHGQLARFELDGEGWAKPVFLDGGISQRGFSVLERIFQGGLDYCRDSIEAAGREVLGAVPPARQSAFAAFEAVFAGTIRVSARLAQAMYLDDTFCGNGEIPCLPGLIASPSRPSAERADPPKQETFTS